MTSSRRLETTLTILNHKLKRGVTVQRDYQQVPFLVNSFGSELNQVWTNIIDNAIDAMNGKGELRVRTYREDNCVVVEIADNGPGIPADVKPHIFEPFLPPKALARAPAWAWTRLQRIVSKHRGNIQVNFKTGEHPISGMAAAGGSEDLRAETGARSAENPQLGSFPSQLAPGVSGNNFSSFSCVPLRFNAVL